MNILCRSEVRSAVPLTGCANRTSHLPFAGHGAEARRYLLLFDLGALAKEYHEWLDKAVNIICRRRESPDRTLLRVKVGTKLDSLVNGRSCRQRLSAPFLILLRPRGPECLQKR
jgi:hypothetical protein